MKNKKYIIISVLFLLFIVSCNKDGPEEMLDNFTVAMQEFDLEKVFSYVNPDKVNSENKDNLNIENQIEKSFLSYLKNNAKNITYEIKDVKKDKDIVTAKVYFKYIDGTKIIRKTLNEYFEYINENFSDGNISEEENSKILNDILNKKIKEIEPLYVDAIIDIECIKKDGNWYIDNPSDELFDVMMSNFISVSKKLN